MLGAGPDSRSLANNCSMEMLDQMGEVKSEPGNGAKGASGAGSEGKKHQNPCKGQYGGSQGEIPGKGR